MHSSVMLLSRNGVRNNLTPSGDFDISIRDNQPPLPFRRSNRMTLLASRQ